MSNRIKLNTPKLEVPTTRQEAEGVVRTLALLKITERQTKAEMDAKVTEVKQRYEGRLTDLAESIGPKLEALHAWAEAHPDEFAGKRSIDMLHGVVGWRTTPPAVKPLRGFTWSAVLERLRDMKRFEFIRTKEEPDKEAILAARKEENLKGLYLQIVQEDEFFVEPSLTGTANRETL